VKQTYHHRDRAEERLQIVGQLGASSIARVHRDERVARHLERQVRSLKIELLDARGLGADNGEDLLRDDREHLEVDAVELVEARPRARRGEPLEELGHREVVEAIRAVEDDALLGERLGEVLGRLGLARAGGALGRATEGELDGPHERAVASISVCCSSLTCLSFRRTRALRQEGHTSKGAAPRATPRCR
jgi:hypothetical protein